MPSCSSTLGPGLGLESPRGAPGHCQRSCSKASHELKQCPLSPDPSPVLSCSFLWSPGPDRGGGASGYARPGNTLGWKGSTLRGEGLGQVLVETCDLWPVALVTLAKAERAGSAQNGQLAY